jgi:hypothetical protein
MKSAKALLEELIRHVNPRRGLVIEVREMPSTGADDPNWVAATGAMDIPRTRRFSDKVAALRKSDPIIDWSNVDGQSGQLRVALRKSRLKSEARSVA